MKKPITIGVIAVIATILVTSAVDYSAIGAKPTNEIYAEGQASLNGEIVCPDGNTKITEQIGFSISFSEDDLRNKGTVSVSGRVSEIANGGLSTQAYNGDIDSGEYLIQGVGRANSHLSELCGLEPNLLDDITVWGECGRDVLINFETGLGYSGSSFGTVICV